MSESKPSVPKRPLSSFFLYKGTVLAKVREQNPSKKITEITKLISEHWAKETGPLRDQVNQKAEDLKAAYKKDMEEYIAKYGKPEPRKRKVAKKGRSKNTRSKKEKFGKSKKDDTPDEDESDEDIQQSEQGEKNGK